MSSVNQSILVVIPTRNRSDLAPTAIRSVLDQHEPRVRVMVSDNSTRDSEIESLSKFCRKLNDDRLKYVRPPAPMAMPQHWEWAMQQALDDASVTHVVYLTDRMLFKRGALRKLTRAIAAHPKRVISYNVDSVFDWEYPIKIRREPWTGKTLGIDTRELAALSARSIIPQFLPRMVNSVAPRTVLEAMRARFGNLFISIAPDYVFAYRFLVHEDMLVCLDESLLIHYALDRSNGHSLGRGIMNDAYKDFVENLGTELTLPEMPLPDLVTGFNVMLNEYRFVSEETGSTKFPPIDQQAYLTYLLLDTESIEDPQARESAQKLLLNLGARPYEPNGNSLASRSFRRKIFDKITWEFRGLASKPLLRPLSRALKIEPRWDDELSFSSTGEALAYLLSHHRRKTRDLSIHPFKSVPLMRR
jgi:glycosyltransferase involved in cell wall biosynthesis